MISPEQVGVVVAETRSCAEAAHHAQVRELTDSLEKVLDHKLANGADGLITLAVVDGTTQFDAYTEAMEALCNRCRSSGWQARWSRHFSNGLDDFCMYHIMLWQGKEPPLQPEEMARAMQSETYRNGLHCGDESWKWFWFLQIEKQRQAGKKTVDLFPAKLTDFSPYCWDVVDAFANQYRRQGIVVGVGRRLDGLRWRYQLRFP